MPIVADVEMPADGFVLGQVLDPVGRYRAELTQLVPTGAQFVPYVRIEADDAAGVEPALAGHPAVAAVTRYDEGAGEALYRIEWVRPRDEFLSILLEGDVLVTAASGTPEGWKFELLAGDQAELAAVQSACTRNDVPIEIRAVRRAAPETGERLGLTARQHRILQLAHDRGYFSVPRAVTVTELGEELDISPQAASKLLRRGLETVVDAAFRGAH